MPAHDRSLGPLARTPTLSGAVVSSIDCRCACPLEVGTLGAFSLGFFPEARAGAGILVPAEWRGPSPLASWARVEHVSIDAGYAKDVRPGPSIGLSAAKKDCADKKMLESP
jgi:hypothetical protein